MKIKLSKWAKNNGLSYQTAYNMFKAERLPVKATQLDTGTILVEETKPIENKVVLYARVSSNDQKPNLSKQLQRLKDFASKRGLLIDKEYTEIGSGINPNRKQLKRILADPSITTIIVEHKDRLTRFGFEMLETTLNAHNRNIVVLNQTELKSDLVQDMIDILTSFCARLYGQRSAKNKVKKAMKAMNENNKK